MSDTQMRSKASIDTPRAQTVDMKLRGRRHPGADVDRAKSFYSNPRLDARRRLRRG